jgi:hypothetical protein
LTRNDLVPVRRHGRSHGDEIDRAFLKAAGERAGIQGLTTGAGAAQ